MVKNLLIVSNNVLSDNKNNGKTILSFIEGIKHVRISQLYFSGEIPQVPDYDYFQISDVDVIKGLFKKNSRGRIVRVSKENNLTNVVSEENPLKRRFGRNDVTMSIRDVLWKNHWKSNRLEDWLDETKPDAVFFVAGDGLYPYEIVEYICKKYNSRLTIYITDDYIMPSYNESLLHKARRKFIKMQMKKILEISSAFFTVSDQMKEKYYEVLGKQSSVIFNMSDDLFDKEIQEKKKNNTTLNFIYTGSLYYGRDDVLVLLSNAIKSSNEGNKNIKSKLYIYTNNLLTDAQVKELFNNDSCEYGGTLNRSELRNKLNESDILVFVESFDLKQIEKTRYSLSTKVPEYLSVGKIIIAIGPKEVSSIQYLSDVAMCINNPHDISMETQKIIMNINEMWQYGEKARKKYIKNHNKDLNQRLFINTVMG